MSDGLLRWWTVLPRLLLLAALAGQGCAPRAKPTLLPPGKEAEEVLGDLARGCCDIKDYAAEGELTVSRERWVMEAEEHVLFGGPGRLRVHLRYRGFLGMLPADVDLLVRGDSVYVSAGPGSHAWRGTRREMCRLWPREGPLLLAALEELGPAGPLACGETPLPSPGSPPEGARGRRGKALSVWIPPGGGGSLGRMMWMDPVPGTLVASDIYDEEARLLAQVTYEGYGKVGPAACPAVIQVEYPREEASVVLRHREQRANLGLADSLFEPDRAWDGGVPWGGS